MCHVPRTDAAVHSGFYIFLILVYLPRYCVTRSQSIPIISSVGIYLPIPTLSNWIPRLAAVNPTIVYCGFCTSLVQLSASPNIRGLHPKIGYWNLIVSYLFPDTGTCLSPSFHCASLWILHLPNTGMFAYTNSKICATRSQDSTAFPNVGICLRYPIV